MNLLAASSLVVLGLVPVAARAQSCGDANGDGRLTVSDGVDVLRASAGLASSCSVGICDVDGSGTINVTDGVVVLRVAADLPGDLACKLGPRDACLSAVRSGNLESSADACAIAAAADPGDAEVRALADGSSAIVAALTEPELLETLDALGIPHSLPATNVCALAVRRRRRGLPAGAPRTGDIVATLHDRGLELIDRFLAATADVPPTASFQFSCPELAEEGIVAEIDYGDLLVARYELNFYAALIHLASAYDVDFDLAGPLNQGASFEDVFVGTPSLFVLNGGGAAAELGLARTRFDQALADFIAAVDFIGAESDDQSNDLFVIGPGDVAAVARERQSAELFRTALNGTARFDAATFALPRDQRLTLDRFFDGKIANLRSFVPAFAPDGDVTVCGVDDPTFGGILPDLGANAVGCLDPNDLDFVGARFGPFVPVATVRPRR
jgi:hypothetical protein